MNSIINLRLGGGNYIDGKYDESQRDISLAWCGSRNQRVIKIQESLKLGQVVTL